MHSSQQDINRRTYFIFWLILFVICLLGITRGIWTPDEPREAEISREMYLSPGIIPTLNGTAFIEKPPLYYWLVSNAFHLTGGPSAAAARAVSGLAGFLTLLCLFFWSRRAHPDKLTAIIATVILATSLQFMISTHWILIDPLLMLFTTIAAWTAWELFQVSNWRLLSIFYISLILALWTKGLVGPVLIGSGIFIYSALHWRLRQWSNFRPISGVILFILSVAVLSMVIYLSGGMIALKEWFWVNHVQRFLQPGYTGHDQPFLYYFWTLPFAVLPWLPLMLDAMWPKHWKTPSPGMALKRYCGSLVIGMLVILSLSSTKRGIYLLPLLPPLALILAINVSDWLKKHQSTSSLGTLWWSQVALVYLLCLATPVALIIYQQKVSLESVVAIITTLAMLMIIIRQSRRGATQRALITLGICSLFSVTIFMTLLTPAVEKEKNMAPFISWVGDQLAPDAPIHVLHNEDTDETLLGIVPFITGRKLILLESSSIDTPDSPEHILTQTKGLNKQPVSPGMNYTLLKSQDTNGGGRLFSLWKRTGS